MVGSVDGTGTGWMDGVRIAFFAFLCFALSVIVALHYSAL